MLVTQTPAWRILEAHNDRLQPTPLDRLFAKDPARAEHFQIAIDGITLDYSKQRLDQEVRDALIVLAEERQLPEWRERLLTGGIVNNTEQRPAMHTALRGSLDADWPPFARQEIGAVLSSMGQLAERIRSGEWLGYDQRPITHVVNIGVGGSDLGPLMACEALRGERPPIEVHFVSSMDGTHWPRLLEGLDPATTLFVIASKTFTTIDTLSNAETVRAWYRERMGNLELALDRHFIGVSASPERMTAWGIAAEHQLPFWDWVGGRYSMWSAIGFPIVVALGMERFRALLDGAHAMDSHFRDAPLVRNMPVMLGLLDVWNHNFLGLTAKAILPYDGRLKHLPAYLQQLVMESNGKSVTRDGKAAPTTTCPVLFGEVGPNAQHAFYQLLHQGTAAVSCDFILPVHWDEFPASYGPELRACLQRHHRIASANFLAQSRVLMLGDGAIPDSLKADFGSPHQHYPGNRPSNSILIDRLDAYNLGQLIALYEHATFVAATIWGINPFDQWGVELGKKIAQSVEAAFGDPAQQADFDGSTRALLQRIEAD